MSLKSNRRILRQPRLLPYLAGAIVPVLLAVAGPVLADGVFKPVAAISMPSGGQIFSFDIGYTDPVLGVYILGDRTNKSVDVINTQTNTVIKQLTANFAGADPRGNNYSGPDGVVLVNHSQVWVGDGPSLLKVLDYNSGALLASLATGGTTRVDEMCWDPVDHVVMAVNNAENPPFATFVSTDTLSIIGKLAFDGTNGSPNATNGAEQCQWSSQTSRFIIAIPEVNGPGNNTAAGGVSVVNPTTFKVEQTFTPPIASCRGPQGAAIGPNFQLALNCNATSSSVIIDVRNGNLIAALPNAGGGDMAWYNPGDNRYFFANSTASTVSGGALPAQVLAVVNNNAAFTTKLVTTSGILTGGNHSVAADPVRNYVYVPISRGSTAGICSSAGGLDANGCIAVFQNMDDTMCFAGGAPVIAVQNDTSPSFLRTLCLLHAVP